MDDTENRGTFYHNIHETIANKYDEEHVSYEWSKRIDKYRKVLCSYAEGNILELGIGTNLNQDFYPKSVSVLGIDWSEEMLVKAREKSDSRFTLEKMDAKHLAFSDNHFDTIVSTFVLSASEDPETVLSEAYRVLKPGGTLYLLDRGLPDSALTSALAFMYRFEYLFKYGYDQ
jgi:ubiquinone/menaquinone biosynthesis C-methylase UbiE